MKQILILGAGPIAGEYSKIVSEMGYKPVVIGRGKISADKFKQDFGFDVLTGGISLHRDVVKTFSKAIVATSEDTLDSVTSELIELGIKHILVEKPGAKDPESLRKLLQLSSIHNSSVYIGYNRRFFQSVLEMKKRIDLDGGLQSMTFEFTEWGQVIGSISKNPGVKDNWLWHNSSHVIDLAFHVGGIPGEMGTFKKGSLDWHPSGEVFVGAGVTKKNVLFSYHANWGGPGRWGLEFVTHKNRYFLRPLEELHVQVKGTVKIEKIELNAEVDKKWKPGYWLQTEAFLNERFSSLMNIKEQSEKLTIYEDICKE